MANFIGHLRCSSEITWLFLKPVKTQITNKTACKAFVQLFYLKRIHICFIFCLIMPLLFVLSSQIAPIVCEWVGWKGVLFYIMKTNELLCYQSVSNAITFHFQSTCRQHQDQAAQSASGSVTFGWCDTTCEFWVEINTCYLFVPLCLLQW